MTLRGQEEIGRAARVLVALGRGDEFNRGVAALAEMLNVEDGFSLKRADDIVTAARPLLALEVSGDFARGVLSLIGALVDAQDLKRLVGEVDGLRGMMPEADVVPALDVAALPAGGDGPMVLDLPVDGGRRACTLMIIDGDGVVEL